MFNILNEEIWELSKYVNSAICSQCTGGQRSAVGFYRPAFLHRLAQSLTVKGLTWRRKAQPLSINSPIQIRYFMDNYKKTNLMCHYDKI
jgi:hypothetical protein